MRSQFPTLEEVAAADVKEVLRWNRFLPRPQDEDELAVINANFDRLGKLKNEDPAAFTRASKELGW